MSNSTDFISCTTEQSFTVSKGDFEGFTVFILACMHIVFLGGRGRGDNNFFMICMNCLSEKIHPIQ